MAGQSSHFSIVVLSIAVYIFSCTFDTSCHISVHPSWSILHQTFIRLLIFESNLPLSPYLRVDVLPLPVLYCSDCRPTIARFGT